MNNHSQQHDMQQMGSGSGLTRYRSAPSSYFDSFLNSDDVGFGTDDFDQLFSTRASSPETQRIFSKFVASTSDTTIQENRSLHTSAPFQSQPQSQLNSEFLPPRNDDKPSIQQQLQTSSDYSSVSQMMNQGGNNSGSAVSAVGNSGLVRHSSSPAGLFANLDIEKEFGAVRGLNNSGPGSTSNAEASFSSAIRFKRHIDFSSKNSSSSGMMAPISKIGRKCTGQHDAGQGEGNMIENHSNDGCDDVPGFGLNSWNKSPMLSDDFFEGLVDNNDETFTNAKFSDTKMQNSESGKLPTVPLSHRHSLPASSAEYFATGNLFADSVPCKIRAKRGFATHPRSIAERVRRTKISDRIRKLQELVPNMEKQTNTSDMLDLAVDYIKDLQKQVKKLSDNGAKCSCVAKEKS